MACVYPNDGPLMTAGEMLADDLQAFAQECPSRDVVVLTHSMDGLVGRVAVEYPEVCDIDRAASFYEAVLAIKEKRVSPGRHYFLCDGTILACFNPQADGDNFQPRANVDYVYIAVDDVEATFQAAKSAGATFVNDDIHGAAAGRVATRPWGERSFYAEDPFGNKLCFVDRATMFTG